MSTTWQSSGRWWSPPPPRPLPHPRSLPRRRGAPFYNDVEKAENCEKRRENSLFFIGEYWKKAFNTSLIALHWSFLCHFLSDFLSSTIFLGPKLCTIYFNCLHSSNWWYAPFGRNKPTGSIEPLSSIGGTFATISRSYLGQGCPYDWEGGVRPWHRLQTLTCISIFLSLEALPKKRGNFGDNGLEN